MKNYILLASAFIVLLFNSCSYEELDLEQSVFIEDVTNPSLPIYSEWGYNTFGTYIDRKPFVSDNQELSAKIIVNADTLNIILKGKYQYEPTTLKFSIKGYPLADYLNLIDLDNKKINLKSENVKVTLTVGAITTNLQIIEGEFYVKRIQKLYVDRELQKSIMSGYFNFKTFLNAEPVAVSNGRFDLGIGYGNFYNY